MKEPVRSKDILGVRLGLVESVCKECLTADDFIFQIRFWMQRGFRPNTDVIFPLLGEEPASPLPDSCFRCGKSFIKKS